jgi:3-hydroxyisobutyrate dehydrogenase-like beta-hydroxyacid dehydrogenase
MGAALGHELVAAGHEVWWTSWQRSQATADRAAEAGLRDAGTLSRLVETCELVISVGPPHAALDMATAVTTASGRFSGRYLDANAVAPATSRQVAVIVEAAGGRPTDGGIIGPPPRQPGTTRLYVSGIDASAITELWSETAVECRVVDERIGSASALKLAYAAWTKGTAALLLCIRAVAEAEDVTDVLLDEWALSQPGLAERCEQAGRSALAKGWRWSGEMSEIAAMLSASGLPRGFYEAAAATFDRVGVDLRPAGRTALDTAVSALRRQ